MRGAAPGRLALSAAALGATSAQPLPLALPADEGRTVLDPGRSCESAGLRDIVDHDECSEFAQTELGLDGSNFLPVNLGVYGCVHFSDQSVIFSLAGEPGSVRDQYRSICAGTTTSTTSRTPSTTRTTRTSTKSTLTSLTTSESTSTSQTSTGTSGTSTPISRTSETVPLLMLLEAGLSCDSAGLEEVTRMDQCFDYATDELGLANSVAFDGIPGLYGCSLRHGAPQQVFFSQSGELGWSDPLFRNLCIGATSTTPSTTAASTRTATATTTSTVRVSATSATLPSWTSTATSQTSSVSASATLTATRSTGSSPLVSLPGAESTTTASTQTTHLSTATTQAHSAGETRILVFSHAGFAVGDEVDIAGGGNHETRSIVGFGSILLDQGLANSYPSGATVTRRPASLSPTPALPIAPAPTATPSAAPIASGALTGSETGSIMGTTVSATSTTGSTVAAQQGSTAESATSTSTEAAANAGPSAASSIEIATMSEGKPLVAMAHPWMAGAASIAGLLVLCLCLLIVKVKKRRGAAKGAERPPLAPGSPVLPSGDAAEADGAEALVRARRWRCDGDGAPPAAPPSSVVADGADAPLRRLVSRPAARAPWEGPRGLGTAGAAAAGASLDVVVSCPGAGGGPPPGDEGPLQQLVSGFWHLLAQLGLEIDAGDASLQPPVLLVDRPSEDGIGSRGAPRSEEAKRLGAIAKSRDERRAPLGACGAQLIWLDGLPIQEGDNVSTL